MKKVVPFSSKNQVALQTPLSSEPSQGSQDPGVADRQHRFSDGAEQQLLLMQRMIGCTQVEELVAIFYRWCHDLKLADGLSFRGAGEAQDRNFGLRRHHSAHYALTLDQLDLGDITFCRRERYSEDELLCLEQALGVLARCLRTALDFAELQQMVTQDPLTGVGNRASLNEWLARELSRSRRHHSPLSLMMIDVDHFKTINDTFGHLGGDKILRAIVEIFKRSTRGSDLLFRFGGDEFTVLLPHTDEQGAIEAAKQIRSYLAELSLADLGLGDESDGLRPDVSIGIASRQTDDCEQSLLQRADTHLYHAKAQGRGAVCSHV